MTEETLREVVATLSEVPREQVTASSPIAGQLAGSMGRARLAAVLRSKHNITSADVYRVQSFGDLCAALGVTGGPPAADVAAVAPVVAAPSLAGSGPSSLQVGIDVEPISALPPALDLWEEPFYRETFTMQEIAYAQLRNDPRASLAAMWCAKEALRKADPASATLDWQRIEVVHDDDRRPSLRVNGQPVAGALSLSHTDELAFGIFVAGAAPAAQVVERQSAAAPVAVASSPITTTVEVSKGTAVVSWVALVLALGALVLSAMRYY